MYIYIVNSLPFSLQILSAQIYFDTFICARLMQFIQDMGQKITQGKKVMIAGDEEIKASEFLL